MTGHIYEFDGVQYPSVTTILDRTQTKEDKDSLRRWRRNFDMAGFKNAEDYVDYTSIRGTIVHYHIFNTLHFSILDPSGLPKLSRWIERESILIPEIEHCVKLWNETGLATELKGPLVIETASHHPLLKYAGTPDLAAMGSHILVDLKTSSGVRDKHKTQLGGYAQMINYHHPGAIREAMLVYLHPSKRRATVVRIDAEELALETEIFNEKVTEFWNIPGIKAEYNL